MRVLFLLLAATALLLLGSQCYAGGLSPEPASPAAGQLVRGTTEFALALYKELAQGGGNVVVSPLGITIATAMLDAGAAGDTRAEIAAAARFGIPEEELHTELKALVDELKARVNEWAELSVANGLWIDSDCVPSLDCVQLLTRFYGAAPEVVEFGEAPEQAGARINGFVSDRTRGKISSVVTPGMFSDLTRLVLADAVYFLGAWEYMFWEKNTKDEPFHPDSGDTVLVSMMHRTMAARYYGDDSVEVLEMPYQGSGLSMLVILPAASRKLADLEGELSPSLLSGWVGALAHEGVDVAIPRFAVSRQIDLAPLLSRMGMRRPFIHGSAELPGLCSDPGAYVDLATHQAFLEITEEGTEAAAATVYRVTVAAERETPAPVPFRADRPFVFIVQDMKRGTILFMGRFVDPRS